MNRHLYKIIITFFVFASFCSSLAVAQPNAEFSITPGSKCKNDEVTFVNLSTGSIVDYLWDFGDGTTSDEINPTHTYTTPGTFTVILTATDAGGLTDSYNKSYIVRPPAANFDLSPAIGLGAPKTIFFTDQSVLPDTWQWNFGDGGTSTAQNPIHSFTSVGDFNVRLTVVDTVYGCSDYVEKAVKIVQLGADFTGSSLFGCGPLTANFTDASTSSSVITSWAWNFGDGGTSSDQNPSHKYDSPGTYTVALTITDENNFTSTKTRTNYVQVIGPSVKFKATSTTVAAAPATINFQDNTTSGSPVTSRTWDFGDGTTSNALNPSHEYTTSGIFDVKLTVTDLDGCSRTLTKTNYINTIPGAYDISIAIYDGNEDRFSVTAQEGAPFSLAFSADGSKMFVIGLIGRDINEYNLTTAWDVSTASYAGNAERLSVASEETSPTSLTFSADGFKMFVQGNSGDDINEYTLTTAWDVSTASYAGDAERFSVASQETSPRSLAFSSDGTKMFVMGNEGLDINEYNLTTAWDVSTASYAGDGERFSVAAQETELRSLAFSADGAKMFVMGSDGDDINEYNLTTAWDVSTATYAGDNERFSVAVDPVSLAFSADGTKMFVMNLPSRIINEYSLAAPVVTGAAANQAVNDNATLSPFSTITVQDPNGDNVSATITLDDNANGRLTGAGLTGLGPYTLASTDAASLQTSLRALVFSPRENRVASGNTETTTFTLDVRDGTFSHTDNRTTVVSSPVGPTVSIRSGGATDPTNGPFTVIFLFSEDIDLGGFSADDITVNNGTATRPDKYSIDISEYVATITPTTDGLVTVDLAAGVVQDLGGADNIAATQFTIEADLTSPTLTISSAVADPTNGAFTTTFTFSEGVTGFDVTDISVGNGTATSFASNSASVYTAVITPSADGTVTVDVAANAAQDAATNGNAAASQFTIEADLTSPTLTISSAAADPTNGAFTATFTFSEDVTGFDVTDISVGNGTATSFASTSASVYTAVITPSADGTVTVDVAANVAQDAASNGNSAASQFTIEADLTSPTLTISSAVADPTNGAFTTTFTFSEGVTGFDVTDISVGNGTATSFASTSASVYTAVITPSADGTVTVDVAANAAQDAATNGNSAASQFTIEADLTSPTLTISSAVADPTNGAFTTTFTFSEGVTGFDVTDISVGNGTATSFASTSASVYTAVITPSADGTVTVDVAANAAQDAATNGNSAASQFTIEADLTSPTLTISSAAADPTNGAFTTTFTFSEGVTGFDVTDISVGNGTATSFASTSASVYTAVITPSADGTVTVDVAANAAQDAATNGNAAGSQFSIEADLTSPNLTINSEAADPTNGTFTTTFTFSEDVTGFDVTDISVGNGAASSFASNSASVYTAVITPSADRTVTVDVAANVAQDAASNGNSAASQFTIEADLTSPTLTISSAAADPTNGAFTTTFTFSEDVTGFDVTDISVGNGAANSFASTSASVYTAVITPETDGTVTINIADNAAQDAATNGNFAATQFSTVADLTPPTVAILHAPALVNTTTPFSITFRFSEAVTLFASEDVSATHASLTNFKSISANEYTVDLAPDGTGNIALEIKANTLEDLAGNGNNASAVSTIVFNNAPLAMPESYTTYNNVDLNVAAADGVLANDSDPDGNALTAILVTDAAAGSLSLSTDGSFLYEPAAGFTGTVTFDYQASDGNVLSDITRVTIVVAQENRPPSFTAGGNITQLEDAGAIQIDNWATNISDGDNETQLLTFQVIENNNPSLFSTAPVITAQGTLTFSLAENAFGTADVTVVLTDNGSVNNTSTKSTFSVNITPVNDPPTIDTPTAIDVAAGSSASFDLSGITAGASNESQTIHIKASTDSPNLITDVVVAYNSPDGAGTVSFNTSGNVSATATIALTVVDDGGTDIGGIHTTTVSLTVNINQVITNQLFLPSLFSPNGDGRNDLFILRGTGIESIVFQVYDARGNKVFYSSNVDEITTLGWNGKVNGSADAPSAAYVWSVSGRFADGTELAIGGEKTGVVRLIR
ncbi:MAG: Ig-like domain-containing protein [Imperialibacter sp.]|uniref:Ig-like domain-containing protein n=1 Tax=Imperialibacter sp. TaxID=2038411 RepID=UPI003A898002